MKPNYNGLNEYLKSHPDYAIEREVRELGLVDFTNMADEELDDWSRWLSSRGYEVVEYVDKEAGLLDSVWINQKHSVAIETLRNLEKRFHDTRKHYRNPKLKIEAIADQAVEIITTLNSMVLARQEANAQ